MQTAKRQAAGLPVEVALVWVLFVAVVTAEVVVTYSRIPSSELYHVSGSGIEGGLSRALVFVNFPVALVALAVLGLIYTRLPGRSYRAVAILAAVLSAAVFWPGIVGQADLDAQARQCGRSNRRPAGARAQRSSREKRRSVDEAPGTRRTG